MAVPASFRAVKCFVFCVCLLPLTGCGGTSHLPPVAASGKVALKGQPLTNGTLHFVPVDPKRSVPGFAPIQTDGTFKAQTYQPGDGLCPGEYIVFFESPSSTDSSKKSALGAIPAKYLSSGTSGLREKISTPTTTLAYDLNPHESASTGASTKGK